MADFLPASLEDTRHARRAIAAAASPKLIGCYLGETSDDIDVVAGLGGPVKAHASIGNHFELLGYLIVALFATAWAAATLGWRLGGFERRYGRERP